MKIVHIFAPERGAEIGEGLWAVEYEGEITNEFDKLLNLWNDAIYMHEFCRKHLNDLREKFGYEIDLDDAVIELKYEAINLVQYLIKLATQGLVGANLQYVFKPLDNTQSDITELQLSKASFIGRMARIPKLRIYAVRIDRNTYVVTGGAIKLTNRMQDRPHTFEQLQRLRTVRDWLKEQGIYYSEDLTNLL
ncbi:MAG TPA: hypothetical protein VGN00_24685 [Puia sp.]|jgi:hypothetical protein